jgi:hypothetical protein
MLNSFLDIRGIIHFEFIPEGNTVNQTFYVEVLKRLTDAMRRKRGELQRDRSLILHHDKAPARSSLRVSQFLAGKASLTWTIPCSLLTWFQLTSGCFQNSKSMLRGKRFSKAEETLLFSILKLF